jgi:transposase InsO family protein
LLWGKRVVIPSSLKETVLTELHREHMGVSQMKALARGHIWWRGMDRDIEALGKSCQACLAVKQAPAAAPLHPWAWPSRPWQRIHIDFAGPFMDKSFLIVVDAHSKLAEVVEISHTTTSRTITALRQILATHGIPEQIVSDNCPQFISADFEEFARTNGIGHIRSSPHQMGKQRDLSEHI